MAFPASWGRKAAITVNGSVSGTPPAVDLSAFVSDGSEVFAEASLSE